jgi:hypothetical protein
MQANLGDTAQYLAQCPELAGADISPKRFEFSFCAGFQPPATMI